MKNESKLLKKLTKNGISLEKLEIWFIFAKYSSRLFVKYEYIFFIASHLELKIIKKKNNASITKKTKNIYFVFAQR